MLNLIKIHRCVTHFRLYEKLVFSYTYCPIKYYSNGWILPCKNLIKLQKLVCCIG